MEDAQVGQEGTAGEGALELAPHLWLWHLNSPELQLSQL